MSTRGRSRLLDRYITTLSLLPLRVRKLVWMSRHPRWRGLLRVGVAPSLEHTGMFAGQRFATVIDVGANRGQFAIWSDEMLRPHRIICFEPLPAARPILAQVASRTRARTDVFSLALGVQESTAQLNVTRAVDNSSLLEPEIAAQDRSSHLGVI